MSGARVTGSEWPDASSTGAAAARRACTGSPPLWARLEPWQIDLVRRRAFLHDLLDRHGSPIHVVTTGPFKRNGEALTAVAARHDLSFGIYFARKANKCLAFVEEANRLGWGVDVSSFEEATQALEVGVPAERLVVTAAVKPSRLLELIAREGIPTVLDNAQEVRDLADVATSVGSFGPLPVAIRLSGFPHGGGKLYSRFGFDIDSANAHIGRLWENPAVGDTLRIRGVHFHLDGYDPAERRSGLAGALAFADALDPGAGHVDFIDIGGGLPVCYIPDASQWDVFWEELEHALLGQRAPLTYRNHGLGLAAVDGRIVGTPHSYPYAQEIEATSWLELVLSGAIPGGNSTVAEELRGRGIELRCEPGRSLLDGAGITAARVVWMKDHPDGHRIAALEMNRTQCRTSSDDFLVDPLVVPARSRELREAGPPTYLTGAYCIENEMLSWRALTFPYGLEAGDLVVWPNTAGYFMHFLESRSHQFPLATNLVWDPATNISVDEIDRWENGRS